MARKQAAVAAKPAPKKPSMGKLEQVAKAFASWRPTAEVFAPIRSVPTNFVQMDHASSVGGLPIGRIVTVHGPSNEGKSLFCLGVVDAYLKQGNPVLYVDAEYTMDDKYFGLICGTSIDTPLFQGLKPTDYEETTERVREFVTKMEEFRKIDVIPREGGSLVVIDSIRKLVPKNLLKNTLKSDMGMDGAKGRGAMMKASLNAQWCDELVPLLDRTNATLIFIARETDDPEADRYDKMAENDFKVGGGKSVIYDASLVIRIKRDRYVGTKGDETTKSIMYGERHKGSIRKTKLGAKRERVPVFYFHSSNGVATKAGLDAARDLLELGERLGVITRPEKSAWYSFEEHKWQGEHSAALAISEDPAIHAALDAAVRARFGKQEAPEEIEAEE